MSTNDQAITKTNIANATEIVKEMLSSPAAERFFAGASSDVSPTQSLLNAHEDIARHLFKLESEASGEQVDISDLPNSNF